MVGIFLFETSMQWVFFWWCALRSWCWFLSKKNASLPSPLADRWYLQMIVIFADCCDWSSTRRRSWVQIAKTCGGLNYNICLPGRFNLLREIQSLSDFCWIKERKESNKEKKKSQSYCGWGKFDPPWGKINLVSIPCPSHGQAVRRGILARGTKYVPAAPLTTCQQHLLVPAATKSKLRLDLV